MKGTSAARIKYIMSPIKRNKWPNCNRSCINIKCQYADLYI